MKRMFLSGIFCFLAAACLSSLAGAQELTKYIDEQRVVDEIDAAATAELRAELEREVDRVVTPNLHLAPVWYQRGIGGNPRMYGNPAELVYALLQARDHVNAALQAKIDTYVHREVRDWPLWQYNWVSQGARREHWVAPSDRIDSGDETGSSKAAHINLYVLWYYGAKTGDTAYLNSNWSAITTFYNYIGTPTNYSYAQVMGIIGYARMAGMLNKTAEYNAARNKATQALSNVLSTGFVQMHANLISSTGATGHKWYFMPLHYRRENGGDGRTGAFYCAELGRFLRDLDRTNVQTDISSRITSSPGGNARYSWWMHYGDQPWVVDSGVGGESNMMGPDYSWSIFMLMADVLDATPQQLVGWLDVPFVGGDSYWMLRQVRAIEAFGTQSWEVILGGGSTTPPPAPSGLIASPASSTQINLAWADNSVDEAGFKIERKTGAAGTWAEVAQTGVNMNSYQDSSLVPSSQYFYRVRAYNSAGDSAYTNEANATTLSAGAATLTLSASDDTYLQNGSGNNYGASTTLLVKASYVSLLRFDLSSIPAGSTVVSAKLSLAAASNENGGDISAYAVLSGNAGWIEGAKSGTAAGSGEPNWSYRNAGTSTAWAGSAGLSTSNVDYKSPAESMRNNAWVSGQRYEWTISSATTQNWINTPSSNHGLVMRSSTGYWPRFHSKESTNASLRPRLIVTVDTSTAPATASTPTPIEPAATTADVSLAAPSHLNAVALGSGRIRLSWVDNSANETDFEIQRKAGEAGQWQQMCQVADTTVWRDSTIKPGLRYYYRVRAMNAEGTSAWSDAANAVYRNRRGK